nr:MAG TPA: hypothetical protein [Caudoviricetes sp.]
MLPYLYIFRPQLKRLRFFICLKFKQVKTTCPILN